MSLRQFLSNTSSSLKARLIRFWREKREIKRAAIAQAVVIFSAFQDWNGLGRGHYSNWTRINAGGQNLATIRVMP